MGKIIILKNMTVFNYRLQQGHEILHRRFGILTLHKSNLDGSSHSYIIQPKLLNTTAEEFINEVKRRNDDPNISSELFTDDAFEIVEGSPKVLRVPEVNFDDAEKIANGYANHLAKSSKTTEEIANDIQTLLIDYAKLKIDRTIANITTTMNKELYTGEPNENYKPGILEELPEKMADGVMNLLSKVLGINPKTPKVPEEPSLQVKDEVAEELRKNGEGLKFTLENSHEKQKPDSDKPNDPQA